MRQGTDCQIGANVSPSPDTMLGDNVTIGDNVKIYPKVTIGDGCQIMDGVVIGRLPLSAGNTSWSLLMGYRPVRIGPGCIIGCNSVLYTNVSIGDQEMARSYF